MGSGYGRKVLCINILQAATALDCLLNCPLGCGGVVSHSRCEVRNQNAGVRSQKCRTRKNRADAEGICQMHGQARKCTAEGTPFCPTALPARSLEAPPYTSPARRWVRWSSPGQYRKRLWSSVLGLRLTATGLGYRVSPDVRGVWCSPPRRLIC